MKKLKILYILLLMVISICNAEIIITNEVKNKIKNKEYTLTSIQFKSSFDELITEEISQIIIKSIPLKEIINDIYNKSKTSINSSFYDDDKENHKLTIIPFKYQNKISGVWKIKKDYYKDINNQIDIVINIESSNKFVVDLLFFEYSNGKINNFLKVSSTKNDWLKKLYLEIKQTQEIINKILPVLKKNNLENIADNISRIEYSPDKKYLYLETDEKFQNDDKLTFLVYDIKKQDIILKSKDRFDLRVFLVGWQKKNNLLIFDIGTDVPRHYKIYNLNHPESKTIDIYGVCHKGGNNYDENVFISDDMKYICYNEWISFDHGASNNKEGVTIQNIQNKNDKYTFEINDKNRDYTLEKYYKEFVKVKSKI